DNRRLHNRSFPSGFHLQLVTPSKRHNKPRFKDHGPRSQNPSPFRARESGRPIHDSRFRSINTPEPQFARGAREPSLSLGSRAFFSVSRSLVRVPVLWQSNL